MSLGMSNSFDILKESPFDHQQRAAPRPAPPEPESARWVGSRFNAQATTEDGQLIVWNTYRGAMSVFPQEQRTRVKALLSQRPVEARREGLVEYLHKRGFLVKEGTDEYRNFQLTFGRGHYRNDFLSLIFLATEDCNFRCQYCYEKFARGTMQPWVREAIKSYLNRRAESLRHLAIGWFGGEPLYGFAAIEDIAPFVSELVKEYSIQYRGHMTTNGFLLTSEVADKLLAWGIDDYQITIDGTPRSHDKKRPARNGAPTFSTILANLKGMSEKEVDFQVVVRVNFDESNYRDLDEFLDIVERELGRDSRFQLRFHPVGRLGGEQDDNLAVYTKNEGAKIRAELAERATRRGLTVKDTLGNRRGLGFEVCYAAKPGSFVVGAEGTLMKCTVALYDVDRNIVGRFTPEGKVELREDNFAFWTEPAFQAQEKCKKCVILPICQGMSCPAARRPSGPSCTPFLRSIRTSLITAHTQRSKEGRRVSL